MKKEIFVLRHVIVNSQLNRDNNTRCYIIYAIHHDMQLHVSVVGSNTLKGRYCKPSIKFCKITKGYNEPFQPFLLEKTEKTP